MDYQTKNKFMLSAIQALVDYIDLTKELDSKCLRIMIKNKRDELFFNGDCESLALLLDNTEYGVGDISFGYTIKGEQLKFSFTQASTGSNLWLANPEFLFEKMQLRAKQEALLMAWFKFILSDWNALKNK